MGFQGLGSHVDERTRARAVTGAGVDLAEQDYTMGKIRDSDGNSNINTYKTEVCSKRTGEMERII